MTRKSTFGFRKRCGWCGVELRRWQRDLCRNCRAHANDPGASSPCVHGSRWDAEPDVWKWRP